MVRNERPHLTSATTPGPHHLSSPTMNIKTILLAFFFLGPSGSRPVPAISSAADVEIAQARKTPFPPGHTVETSHDTLHPTDIGHDKLSTTNTQAEHETRRVPRSFGQKVRLGGGKPMVFSRRETMDQESRRRKAAFDLKAAEVISYLKSIGWVRARGPSDEL